MCPQEGSLSKGSLRQSLRKSTSILHKQLDQKISELARLNPETGYAIYLDLMFALYKYAEPSMEFVSQEIPELKRPVSLVKYIKFDREQFNLPDSGFINHLAALETNLHRHQANIGDVFMFWRGNIRGSFYS
ncbi:MAG: hypothetical protein R3C11_12875 [Planctomycetaceae bacterium]